MGYTPFKMKGSPMQRNFGIGSPMKKEEESGSVQEVVTKKEVSEGRTYVEGSGKDEGVIKSAGMVILEKNEPPKDSSEYASWLKAYNAEKAKHHKKMSEKG